MYVPIISHIMPTEFLIVLIIPIRHRLIILIPHTQRRDLSIMPASLAAYATAPITLM